MPLSSVERGVDEVHMEAWDTPCGVFTAGPASVIRERVAVHFAHVHPERAVVVEGTDYTVEPGPWRCDGCNTAAEPPWWRHVCTPPMDTETTIDNDGIWLLCTPCHDDVGAVALGGLVARAMEVAALIHPGLLRDAASVRSRRRYYARHYATLVPRLDAGLRITSVSL